MISGKSNDAISKSPLKSNSIKLIKVPKFVASKWLEYNDKDIVGLLEENNNEISAIYIQKENSDEVKKLPCNKNSTVSTYILKEEKVSLNINNKNPNSVNNNLSNKTNENMNQDNLETDKEAVDYVVCADIINNCSYTYSFLPTLDKDYSLVLKERHYKMNVKKDRYTIIETRNEDNIDSSHTLFKYYNTLEDGTNSNLNSKDPRDNSIDNSNKYGKNNKRGLMENDNNIGPYSASKQKAKQAKKMHVFDLDKTKISMFKIFEKEGKKGVPFSFFSKSFSIPSNYIKNILDEIAVKRKRVSDKKTVYFLKDYIS
ncbi:transcription initiation factor IIF subunit beta, putative [Plasmodium vinckei brucechwatti]|uniref:Transcription initiation factor IIF subunit beta, putative n=1 Tax=Plasmodium vinckei brucechwatti TaxID=119398 RepID=A0A6V7S5A2_PLAVN|nr:transcription initiation factor IIF subunit beta, putative [Plasmodium vinckei brucechwatti]